MALAQLSQKYIYFNHLIEGSKHNLICSLEWNPCQTGWHQYVRCPTLPRQVRWHLLP